MWAWIFERASRVVFAGVVALVLAATMYHFKVAELAILPLFLTTQWHTRTGYTIRDIFGECG